MITKELKEIGFRCKNMGTGCKICKDKYICIDSNSTVPDIDYDEYESSISDDIVNYRYNG